MLSTSSSLNRARKNLLKALSSERQAIAIYSAEVALFKAIGRSHALYSSILQEEQSHGSWIESYMSAVGMPGSSALQKYADDASGTILGFALALLPMKLRHSAHVWAEKEAARIYRECADAIREDLHDLPNGTKLEQELRTSAAQESEHAMRFLMINDKGNDR